jgi:N-acetylglucosamine malate deacetylase 1
VSDVYEKKIDAIKCYDSQFYSTKYSKKEPETYISSKRFMLDIETRARFFGFKIGVEFGEPFFCYENLKVNSEMLFDL